MRVELLNVGWISGSAAVWRQGEDPDRLVRFPIPAFLIETNEERILIDTGLNRAGVEDPGAFYGRPELAAFQLQQEAGLTELLDLSTLTRVVLTHLHFDHAGGLGLIPPSIPIVVQRREWEAGHDAASVKKNFFYPRDYAIDDRELVLVDGDHDLLGDGSIELLLTPGHTPGHQSVRVGDGLILGIDVAHFASSFEDHRFPVFADDHAAQARSAERLCGLRDAGARLLPGHDPEVLRPGEVIG
jgi:N-acyl homoserine lactone hydrolase